MKIFLPVFLALCLGVAPVFSEAVAEDESIEASQAEDDFEEASVLPSALSNASASSITEVEETATFGSDVPQLSMLRAFGGMGLVLCLLAGAYFGIRKLAPAYFPKMSPDGKNLKIVESLGMGDRRSIALVEVGGKRFLIGSTPQQINLLTVLPEHFSSATENNEISDVRVVKFNEEGEKNAFRNLLEVGKKRPSRQSASVISEEVRQKMHRLREAMENR